MCKQERPLPALLLALGLLVLLGPSPAEGRASACNGAFECSSTTSEDPDLILEFSNTSVTCKYGHTEIDGDCRRGCRGVRSAPCRCQTQEEAEDGIKTDARTSLLAALLTIVLGCCCTCGSYRKLFKAKVPDESNLEDQAEPAEGQRGPDAANENDPEVAAPAPPPAPDATAEGSAAATEASMPRRRNVIEVASSTVDKLAQEHPCKIRIVRIVIPLAILALLTWGAYQLAVLEGHIYDTFGSFIGAVILFMFALSLASIIILHLAKRRCCRKEDPFACVSQAAGMVIMLAPTLGAVGLVWSVHRMLYPGGFYHAC